MQGDITNGSNELENVRVSELMTIEAAAELLGWTHAQVRHQIRRGGLRAIKPGAKDVFLHTKEVKHLWKARLKQLNRELEKLKGSRSRVEAA